jgi:hypothetical protein
MVVPLTLSQAATRTNQSLTYALLLAMGLASAVPWHLLISWLNNELSQEHAIVAIAAAGHTSHGLFCLLFGWSVKDTCRRLKTYSFMAACSLLLSMCCFSLLTTHASFIVRVAGSLGLVLVMFCCGGLLNMTSFMVGARIGPAALAAPVLGINLSGKSLSPLTQKVSILLSLPILRSVPVAARSRWRQYERHYIGHDRIGRVYRHTTCSVTRPCNLLSTALQY